MKNPVNAVNITCANGDRMPRMKNTSPTAMSRRPDSAICTAKYWMFSLNAKPPATSAANTMPSTGPSK